MKAHGRGKPWGGLGQDQGNIEKEGHGSGAAAMYPGGMGLALRVPVRGRLTEITWRDMKTFA